MGYAGGTTENPTYTRLGDHSETIRIEYDPDVVSYSDLMAAGIVLSGGSSGLQGITERAEDVTKLPVRVGKPTGVTGLTNMVDDPKFATGVGLVMYGAEQTPGERPFRGDESSMFNNILERMKQWLTDLW